MSKVLVIGASRGIGLQTVKKALKRHHSVRAFARSADQISVQHKNLERWSGDALDADAVTAALNGMDVVIQVLGVPASPNVVLKPTSLFSTSTRILLNAMDKTGVTKMMCVTGFGAGDSHRSIGCIQRIPFDLILRRVYDDKTIQEAMIRDSNRDWIIARPGILVNKTLPGRYRVLVEPRRWRNGLISRAEVADFLTNQIASDRYVRKTPVLVH